MMLPSTQLCTCALMLLCTCALCTYAHYICRDSSTFVVSALQIRLFMQNKANFRKSQINVNKVLTKDYDKRTLGQRGKTKPIQSQLKPIKCQNKANSNPIKPNIMPKQTQFKPKQSQFQAGFRIRFCKKPQDLLSRVTRNAERQNMTKRDFLKVLGLSTASAVKKFHLILVLHRRILFNSGSNCEMEKAGNFAKESKMAARQAHKLTFWDPLETLTRLR